MFILFYFFANSKVKKSSIVLTFSESLALRIDRQQTGHYALADFFFSFLSLSFSFFSFSPLHRLTRLAGADAWFCLYTGCWDGWIVQIYCSLWESNSTFWQPLTVSIPPTSLCFGCQTTTPQCTSLHARTQTPHTHKHAPASIFSPVSPAVKSRGPTAGLQTSSFHSSSRPS